MTVLQHETTVLAIDLGKTSCRAALVSGDRNIAQTALDGVAWSSDIGTASADRILATIALLPSSDLAAATACGVGAAGILTDPAAGSLIAGRLHEQLGLPVAVTSDIITAHLGAFEGASGITLVAGTGAVAIGLDDLGTLTRVDGWGPDIGDLGGGTWIGREAVRAVLLARAGVTAATALEKRLDALTAGAGADPVTWVATAENPARQLARLAPAVLDEAAAGDTVALDIAMRAIGHLTASAAAAASPTCSTVAVLGGLAEHEWFESQLNTRLAESGLDVVVPASDALFGAQLAARRNDLPHERHIHRA